MHYFIDQIAFKSEMRGPTFQCESVGEGALRLHYFSHRQGLFPIVKGLVRRTARLLFDMEVKVNVVERSQERRKSGMVEHVVFSLEPDEEHRAGKRLAYKFKRQTRASSDLEVCDPVRQMMPVDGGNSIVFLCSPHVTSVRDILNLKLFISDMPMHDATRDLVMLNQSRICQMELKKLKGLAEELDKKKHQTDQLLFEFVPSVVADAFRLGKVAPPQEFTECSVMFADVPDFVTISGNCKPAEVVDVVEQLFKQFDFLIHKHQVVACCDLPRVLIPVVIVSVLQSVVTDGQLPCGERSAECQRNPCREFAKPCARFRIYWKACCCSRNEPSCQGIFQVRVGISCGPVVAGVVSQEKPRYCIFGQTVNIAKQIRSFSLPGRILLTNSVRALVAFRICI
ncbi:adenylate/guanylate cyclase catalytic domain protein [Ancylostoma ceylanicum]|uniref:guanylate cyclase n=1 Tax=Ancylostoma ceylanicum TaxID=53326 RepID=A0A0D6LYN5_9BILA|nr:adenylate/guanylate cyclase catalytic domain protein [Ancylostoma ceylanicum]